MNKATIFVCLLILGVAAVSAKDKKQCDNVPIEPPNGAYGMGSGCLRFGGGAGYTFCMGKRGQSCNAVCSQFGGASAKCESKWPVIRKPQNNLINLLESFGNCDASNVKRAIAQEPAWFPTMFTGDHFPNECVGYDDAPAVHPGTDPKMPPKFVFDRCASSEHPIFGKVTFLCHCTGVANVCSKAEAGQQHDDL